jgi:hypothetical protein
MCKTEMKLEEEEEKEVVTLLCNINFSSISAYKEFSLLSGECQFVRIYFYSDNCGENCLMYCDADVDMSACLVCLGVKIDMSAFGIVHVTVSVCCKRHASFKLKCWQ